MRVVPVFTEVSAIMASMAAFRFSDRRARFPSTIKRTLLSMKVLNSFFMDWNISSIRAITSASGRFQFSSEKA